MNLNEEQRRAVETVEGRVLILAGAGSGKTRVITYRIIHLIQNLGASPQSILGLTFTNKAAQEMRQRIGEMLDPKVAKQVTLCTFHSFCMQVLRKEIDRLGYTKKFTLYDERDMQRILNGAARELIEHEGQLPSLSATTALITDARNKGLKPSDIVDTTSEWHQEFAQNLYQRLQEGMRAYNAVDFDTLLSLTVELFEKFPEVLDQYQERFRYIMIDEYQDTNPIQYRLASLLSKKYNNLCVVGDDDQSIYGWRGAEIRNILNFTCDTKIKLETNYRSKEVILEAANHVISKNAERHAKVLRGCRGKGDLIEVFHAPTEGEEAEAVVHRIAKLREQGMQWRDIAILYRSNSIAKQFEMALMKHRWQRHGEWIRGVPYQVFGGTEFYERKEVKDLLAYVRVVANPSDDEALLRIINQPRRGIGDTTLDIITQYNRKNRIPLKKILEQIANDESPFASDRFSARSKGGICSFVKIVHNLESQLENGGVKKALEWLVETINYQKAIHEEVKSPQMRAFKWENVQELIKASGENQFDNVQDFIAQFSLSKEWGKTDKELNEDKVTLMTIHSAKGLEFPVCFLVGMEDQLIPHERSLEEGSLEEERRLMYVAITRAKDHLVMSMSRQRSRHGKLEASRPSRFMFEIPKELMNVVQWHDV